MRLPVLCLVLLLVAARAGAQTPTFGRIEGEVFDSIHAKPLAGATILLTRVVPEPSAYLSAATDEKGRFRFDSLLAGNYSIGFLAPMLDSLEVSLPPRSVTLAAGEKLRTDFAIPTGATFRAAACPGLVLPKGQGAVVGEVADADNDKPLAGAQIAVTWSELTVDRQTLKASTEQRTGAVRSDSLGGYRLCGVPTDSYLLVQVQDKGRVGSVVRLTVPDDIGLAVRRLSISMRDAPSIAQLDSAATNAADEPRPALLLRGTATLTGTVRSTTGQPHGEAQVRVVSAAAGSARTDSAGRFELTGLPAGTQVLEVRRVGYLLGQFPVELRSGRSVDESVTLARIVSLDSIRVVAQRARYRDFEQNRRVSHGFGRFLTEQDIEARHPFEASDLVRMMPGFRTAGSGLDTKIVSSRGPISFRGGACETNIVIDGMQHQDINLVHPSDIGALEAYSGPAGAPPQYDAACGVIVIWTKR